MLSFNLLVAVCLAYVCLLFLVAFTADQRARRGKVRWLDHPLKLPTYPVKQHWHERYHLDSRNQWLRRIVADVFAGDVLGSIRL